MYVTYITTYNIYMYMLCKTLYITCGDNRNTFEVQQYVQLYVIIFSR